MAPRRIDPRHRQAHRVPLCVYRTGSDVSQRLGLIAGEPVIDVARAGGPATLSAALQLSAADLRTELGAVGQSKDSLALADVTLDVPMDEQEIWAA